ncbi:NAD(P)-binding protein [Meredithblackwellia eburnea MCA 4105]
MTRNQTLIFEEIPTGFPIPGQTTKLVENSIDLDKPLQDGQVLTKTVVLSLDPYLRGKLRDPDVKSYAPAFELGKPLSNFGVSRVVRSANTRFMEGDHVYSADHVFSEYQLFGSEEAKGLMVLENKEGLPWTTWVGAAGMPGTTAWFGLDRIARPQKGETIFVSGASGAVGQMVIGLCKRLGLRTIGSAGSDDKVDFLKNELQVDVAFNYKTTSTKEILSKEKFHIYWDNVGGETLDDVLATIEEGGRIVSCGMISLYNGESYGVKNTAEIFKKQLKFEGFIVIKHDVSEFYKTVPGYIASGEIYSPKEHIIKGLDNGEGLLDVMKGGNFGKSVITFE